MNITIYTLNGKYFLVPECLLACMDGQVLIVAAKCTKCLHCSARAGWLAGAEDLLSSRLHPRPLVQLPGEIRARYNLANVATSH